MACRHPHETIGCPPPGKRPPPPRRPRSTTHGRSPARTAADAHGVRPADDRVSASRDAPQDRLDVCLSPSQLLFIEVLRRPLESTQYTSLTYSDRLDDLGI